MASKLSALIAATTEKTAPADADKLPLLDSAATNYFKWIGWGSLKTALQSVFATLAGKSGGQTLIGGPGVTDKIVLQGTSGDGTIAATALEVKVGNNGSMTALTVENGGRVNVSGNSYSQTISLLKVGNAYSGLYIPLMEFLAPNMGSGQTAYIAVGLSASNKNRAGFNFYMAGIGSSDNYIQCGSFYGNDNAGIRAYADGRLLALGGTSATPILELRRGAEQLRLGYDASNYASFAVASDGTLNLTSSNNKITYGTSRTPASAAASGTAGEVCWDSSYIYVCTAANTWKRAALTTW